MAMYRRTVGLLSVLALALGPGGVGQAQTFRNYSQVLAATQAAARTAFQARFGLPPSLFQNARYYSYQQILAQTLADNSPDAAEVHTYLRNPVQWQRNMVQNKAYELGLPQWRIILADGTIIRTYLRPPLPQGWRYHLFTDPPPKGFFQFWIYDPTHLYQIQTPPGSPLMQQMLARLATTAFAP
jgi:hypothetical protein